MIFWPQVLSSCWTRRSKEPGAAAFSEREKKSHLSGRQRLWFTEGAGFLSGDRLLGHRSLHNLATAGRQRLGPQPHAAELSKVQWAPKSGWERSRPAACCIRKRRVRRVPAEHLQAPGVKPRCKERQNQGGAVVQHPASLLAALANGALYVPEQNTLSKVWVDTQHVNTTFPGLGGFPFSSPFLEQQGESPKHILHFIYASVTLQ